MNLLREFIGVPERQILHEVHIQKLINLALPETFTYCMSYRDIRAPFSFCQEKKQNPEYR